ncbi:hypothetical protein BS47DRAFT_1168731 [Hydnum rufescens UP504]|uniref:Uncharacterized protein n=1 Tax=Hydnum rufescens UP504 TaxID=1448309 RepID=A0A9P6DUE4_9AGAM|nr:hypothetical protein BS47DRAFT_1168731 [Hydnum rufescens UP504]
MKKVSPHRGGGEHESPHITKGYVLLPGPRAPVETTLSPKFPPIKQSFLDRPDRHGSPLFSSVFRRFSTASVQSNLVTHSWPRPAKLKISDLSSYITSTPPTPITRLKWYKNRYGVQHEFLLLEVKRSGDGSTLWLRLDRRMHENARVLKIISSPVPSGDTVEICNDVSRLFDASQSLVQVETEFTVPPPLQRLGNLLSILMEDSPDYKLYSVHMSRYISPILTDTTISGELLLFLCGHI